MLVEEQQTNENPIKYIIKFCAIKNGIKMKIQLTEDKKE